MTDANLDQRLAALESRLGRLETVLGTLADTLDRHTSVLDRHAIVLDRHASVNLDDAKAGIQAWVTEYVSLRLQQLVPETCEHEPKPEGAPEEAVGPVLPGTRIRCTDEVLHRLGRIPIPFVRQMVTEKVAETARAERVSIVDVGFFERSATF
jgi:uncharacterized coiled-coil protein SlyX